MYRLHGFFTQNTMKTVYVLEALGVEFEFAFVNLMKRENRNDAFRAMTPARKVPVLEHDGEFLFESGSICRYVAGVEKSPLYPADELERGRVDQWMTFFTCHPGRWLTTLYFQKVMKPVAGLGDPDKDRCEEAERFAGQQLGIVERWLADHDWLANDALSIAEPFALAYMEQAGAVGFSLDEWPRVKSWFLRQEEFEWAARARARVEPHMRAAMAP